MTSKKILHVVSSMNPILGGVCKAVETISTSLINESIDNEVISLDNPQEDFIGKTSFKIYALGNAQNPWGYHAKLAPWLKDNVLNYDFIIVHGLWLYNSYSVYKVFKSLKKHLNVANLKTKYYVMPHGMLDPYFQKAKERKFKAIRNTIYWKLLEHKVINNADGLLFTCEEEQQLAKEPFLPYTPKKEIIVGLGVEEPPAHSKAMDVTFFKVCQEFKNRSYLLFLSRIHEKKGVDLLIEAYVKIATKFSNSSENKKLPGLVIAGPGLDSDYGKLLLNKVSQNDILKNNVVFPGMLSGDTKWGAFYNCDAFILPSHQENFGIAIVEAMACSKPVLISNKINIWKEINNSAGGIVGNDTISGTINTLEKWINLSENEKLDMQDKAKLCYKDHFALGAVVSNWKNKVINTE